VIIAQVSPLYESVPPQLYGGTERVVSYLTEELVRQGHDVTLFASGDSRTAATLAPMCSQGLRLGDPDGDALAQHYLMLEQVFGRADDFDVIHLHTDYLHFPLARRCATPCVTTLHGRLDLPHTSPLLREYAELPLISISDDQRKPVAWANWQATVHHGLPQDLLTLHPRHDGYLAFAGRVSPEKRPDLAIEIARRAGIPLRIAAKVDRPDRAYFKSVIEPLIDGTSVEYVGEIDERQKDDFFGNALALLFPIDWPEPFGLVMIEAMACGTPVIAFPRGSVPEVIDHGRSGFIVENVEEAVFAVARLDTLRRERCRETFEQRFTAQRMAADYLHVYHRVRASTAHGVANMKASANGAVVVHDGTTSPVKSALASP
jgi:glycosyltransferase involved in cell wall biosynthesis